MKTYNFDTQLKLGQGYEKDIFEHLKKDNWIIDIGDRSFQQQGIDCIISKGDLTYSIEIKSDTRASKTGNLFIETISVDRQNKKGWAYTTQSDFIFYYLPIDLIVYILSSKWVKASVKKWESIYPKRTIKNQGYNTVGLLIPLWFFEENNNGQTVRVINLL